MILRRLDPTQSPNGNDSRWPKAHRVRCGSISEVTTLYTPCSGGERKAEPICCLISCVFSSQFGHKPPLGGTHRVPQIPACLSQLPHTCWCKEDRN